MIDLTEGPMAIYYEAAVLYLCGWIENRLANIVKSNAEIVKRRGDVEVINVEDSSDEEEEEDEEDEEEEEEEPPTVARKKTPTSTKRKRAGSTAAVVVAAKKKWMAVVDDLCNEQEAAKSSLATPTLLPTDTPKSQQQPATNKSKPNKAATKKPAISKTKTAQLEKLTFPPGRKPGVAKTGVVFTPSLVGCNQGKITCAAMTPEQVEAYEIKKAAAEKAAALKAAADAPPAIGTRGASKKK
jgi:hypothetical protein